MVVTFFAVTMMPAYRSEITGSQSGQIVATLIGKADQFLPADIHETVDPFLQQFRQQFDGEGVRSPQGGVAGGSSQNGGDSWHSVLEGVTSVAAWAGVETEPLSGEKGAQLPASVEAAAAWMTSPSSSETGIQSAGRYLGQKSAFGGSNTAVPASVLNNQPENVPQRFPVGAQTPLPVRP